MFIQFFFGYLVNRYPPQRFHLVDKLITAKMFNAHVRPARTVHAYFSDDENVASCALYAVPRVHVQNEVYFVLKIFKTFNGFKFNQTEFKTKGPMLTLTYMHILEPGVSKGSFFFVHADLSVSLPSLSEMPAHWLEYSPAS